MVPQTMSRWMSITLNWNSSVVETNTLVSFTVHCLVHLGHTYHTHTDPSLRDEPTTVVTARCYDVVVDRPIRRTHARTPARISRCCRPPVTLHTVVRLLAYAVVVDRPFRCTHSRTPARIRRRREVTNALYHCTAASEYSRPRSLPHSNCG